MPATSERKTREVITRITAPIWMMFRIFPWTITSLMAVPCDAPPPIRNVTRSPSWPGRNACSLSTSPWMYELLLVFRKIRTFA